MPPAAAINYAVKLVKNFVYHRMRRFFFAFILAFCLFRFPNLRSILTASAAELAEKGVTPDARANRVTALFKKRVNDFAIND